MVGDARTWFPKPRRARSMVVLLAVVPVLMLAGCGLGNPVPTSTYGAPAMATEKVALIGDSLLLQADGPIRDTLAWYHLPADVIGLEAGGSSLLCWFQCGPAPDGSAMTPLESVSQSMAKYRPDIVITDWGFNIDSHYDDPGFDQAAYRARLLDAEIQMTNIVTATGAHLYWADSPQILNPWNNGLLDTNADRAFALPPLGVTIISWRRALDDTNGNYADWLDVSGLGDWQQVRADDHSHLAPDGANRVAAWTVAAIRTEWDHQISVASRP
jgi:hypothetical protein